MESATVSPPAPIAELFPNESSPPVTPAATSTVEKIRRAASGVFEKYGVQFKRGRGRPRADGFPGKGDVPLNAPPTALPAGASPGPATPVTPGFDPKLVKNCVRAVVKALTGFADKILRKKAALAGYSAADANQLVVDCTITAEEIDSFSDLAEICLRKYGVGTEYVPEIGLASIAAGVGLRYMVAIKSLQAKGEQPK